MNRLLVFHSHADSGATGRMSPSAYYVDEEYDSMVVRVYAEDAPTSEATFTITSETDTGTTTTLATVYLNTDQTREEIAEDLDDNLINAGEWVYCTKTNASGAGNITVQVELVSED